MNINDAYIIPFSGGLDSTYLLYRSLKEGKRVFPFHISIKHNAENRWREELNSVKCITKWLKQYYPKLVVKYMSMNFSSINVGYDTDQVLLFSQKYCYSLCKRKDIKNIYLTAGAVMDDNTPFHKKRSSYNGIGLNVMLWNSLLDAMLFKVKIDNIKKIHRIPLNPLFDDGLYKKDIVKLIPTELLDMVYVCRHNNNCGKCGSCKKHIKALEVLNV